MKLAHVPLGLWCLACVACSASPGINVGNETDGSVAGSGGASGFGGIGGFGGGDNTLTALVTEPPSEMAIDVVTVSCAGECKHVLAVASGGNDPYTFTWNDGVTGPARDICATNDTTFSVTVTDTAIVDGEFPYAAQSVTASVTARVLTCPSDAGVDAGSDGGSVGDAGTIPLCAGGVSPPFRLMDAAPTLITSAYQQANGLLADYRSDSAPTGLAVVALAHLPVDIGSCTQLLLAADAAGTIPVGWDNVLIVEYHAAPGVAASERWYYGAAINVVHAPTNQTLPQPMQPTVSGLTLNPSIPNPLPFGYAPLAIDLMDHVPDGVTTFELTLIVADMGGYGSSTEIWAIPR